MKTNHHLEEESNMNGKIAIVWFDILIGNREKKEGQFKKQICLQDKQKDLEIPLCEHFQSNFIDVTNLKIDKLV